MTSQEVALRSDLAEMTRLIYEKGYTPPLNGNLSCRLDDQSILITPSHVCKSDVTPERILKVDMNGNVIDGEAKPSIETKMHLAIYQERPEITAVIHAHPKFVSIFAVANKPIDISIMPESIYIVGEIKTIPYLTPGSEQLTKAVKESAKEYNTYLLQNHGMITIGRNLNEAFYRLETLELCAHTQYHCLALGGAVKITGENMDILCKIRDSINKAD